MQKNLAKGVCMYYNRKAALVPHLSKKKGAYAMSELLSYLSSLDVPDLVLCAVAVVFLDVFALAIVIKASQEAKLCRKRWEHVSAGMELRAGGETWPLEADEILLGRHVSADIRFLDSSVSRYHAVMTVTGGVWSITDLDSRAGTFVNDRRVKQSPLHAGDIIRLGGTEMVLCPHGAPRPGEAVPKKKKGGRRRV